MASGGSADRVVAATSVDRVDKAPKVDRVVRASRAWVVPERPVAPEVCRASVATALLVGRAAGSINC